MKILITGATGLVGTELVSLLHHHKHDIHYLSTSKDKLHNEGHLKGFYWNPQKGEIDQSAFFGVETIVHLAGASISKRWTKKYKQEVIESRVLSADLIFNTLKNHSHKVKQFVSASAIGIYPDSLKVVYTEENKSIDDGFLGHVVEKWEKSADKFKLLNIKVCKLRTGLVLSEKGGAMAEMVKPIKWGIGAPFGNGKQYQSWIHIHDLVEMYRAAIEDNWEGTFNAVAPNPVTNKELTVAIAHALKKPLFMPNIPEFLMQLVLGEMHQLLFSSQNVSARKAQGKGFKFEYERLEKALNNLLPSK
ncbi:TIGR01777 family oxidoreductase [Flavobacterium sp.]|uniref:TIGR01777 family oxidoreductase n=1 Tax=Flavobacterium sp. TaxID=239 RepID=UPI0026183270|nr:TIGR01777 family oxidoreductase [Flavobacterium sp.]